MMVATRVAQVSYSSSRLGTPDTRYPKLLVLIFSRAPLNAPCID